MSNGEPKNVYERLWKLWAMVCKLVLNKRRDPEQVAECLQSILARPAKSRWRAWTDLRGEETMLRAGDALVFHKNDGSLWVQRGDELLYGPYKNHRVDTACFYKTGAFVKIGPADQSLFGKDGPIAMAHVIGMTAGFCVREVFDAGSAMFWKYELI